MAPLASTASTWRTVIVAVVLFAGTLALFSRAFNYPFTNLDDTSYLTNNPHVQGGLSWAGAKWAFTGRTDYWHPLTWLSHQLDWELYEWNASGHRVTSILWHALNAVLVFFVTRRLTGAFWISALAAALFAWHPLRVESVIWLPERKDVMSGCFFLLTVWAYLEYARRRTAALPHGRRWYGLTLAAFAASLMCKPVTVTVPGVLLLLDVWPLRRLRPEAGAAFWRGLGRLLGEKLPFFALSVAIALVTVRLQQHAGAFTLDVALLDRVGNALVSLPRYLGKFFWPFDLTVVYPHPGSWPAAMVALAAVVVLAITAGAIACVRRWPWVLTGWGWFLLLLLPVIGLVQVGFQAMADRYTYLPMLGWQLAFLGTVHTLLRTSRARRVAAALAGLALLGCVVRTWQQQAVWRDPPSLFAHAIAVSDDNYAAHAFYGLTVLTTGNVAEAEAHAQRAVALRPDFAAAHDTLAMVRKAQGRWDEAIASLRRVLELSPDADASRVELADVLLQRQDLDAAEAEFRAVVRGQPEHVSAWAGLARVELARGNASAAIAHWEHALELRPDYLSVRNELAVLLATLHREEEAVTHFEASLRVAPDHVATHFNLGRVLVSLGRIEAAVPHLQRAMALEPNDPNLYQVAGDVLSRAKHFAAAVTAYEHAVRLRPALADYRARLGYAYLLVNRPADAAAQWEEALRLDPAFPGLRERLARVRPAADVRP